MANLERLEEFVEVAGAKIHLLKGGQGKPLVVLHSVEGNLGWLSYHRSLAQHFTVYAPTHAGFGLSQRPPWLETLSDLARFYLWLLQELGLEFRIFIIHEIAQDMYLVAGNIGAQLDARNDSQTGELLSGFVSFR